MSGNKKPRKNTTPRRVPAKHAPPTYGKYPCCRHCGETLEDLVTAPQENYARYCSWNDSHMLPCPKCQVGSQAETLAEPQTETDLGGSPAHLEALIRQRMWRVGTFHTQAAELFSSHTALGVPFGDARAVVLAIIAADEAAGRTRDIEDQERELEHLTQIIEQKRGDIKTLKAARKKIKRWLKENR